MTNNPKRPPPPPARFMASVQDLVFVLKFSVLALLALALTSRPALGQTIAASTALTPMVRMAGSGWIDFVPTESGHLIIPVVLNGEHVRALIDTGFDQVVVSKPFADAHHLPLTPTTKPVSFGGPAQFYMTPSMTIDVGEIRTTKPGTLAVTDFGALSSSMTQPFDVVIGLSYLALGEWEIDQDNRRFRLLKSGTIPITGGAEIHVGSGSRLLTTIEVNGKTVSPAMVDLGDDGALYLTQSIAEEVGFKPLTDLGSHGVGGDVVQPLGRVDDLAVGSSRATGIYATSSSRDWLDPSIKASIGLGFLQRYNMVVDIPLGKMQLIKRVTLGSPIAKTTSGVQGSYNNGRLTIQHVMKNSPAEVAGLRGGDQICALNGVPMSRRLYESHWGRSAPGTKYDVKLCNGTSRTLISKSFY